MKKLMFAMICCVAVSSAFAAEYVVKKGDNLFRIARNLDVSVYDLTAVNDLPNPDRIYAGQKLKYVGKDDIARAAAWHRLQVTILDIQFDDLKSRYLEQRRALKKIIGDLKAGKATHPHSVLYHSERLMEARVIDLVMMAEQSRARNLHAVFDDYDRAQLVPHKPTNRSR